jgi:V8-like Glu-specific endopeptidase
LKRWILGAVALAALALGAGAFAITNGTPDGNAHPYVGALLAQQAFSDGTWEECTGTLISPTVFLTAEHCDEGVSRVKVTFDSSYDAATGTTYSGTWHGDPQYSDPGNSTGDPHDIAVVVLDKAVKGITPAKLPTVNQLASLTGGDPIVSVGYGAQSVTQDKGKTLNYADVRYVATGSFTTLTQVYLKASMNPAHGDGGTCYGDSGGPNFIGSTNVEAATTITGDMWCRSTNVDYRLDTPVARAFLAQFVKLP